MKHATHTHTPHTHTHTPHTHHTNLSRNHLFPPPPLSPISPNPLPLLFVFPLFPSLSLPPSLSSLLHLPPLDGESRHLHTRAHKITQERQRNWGQLCTPEQTQPKTRLSFTQTCSLQDPEIFHCCPTCKPNQTKNKKKTDQHPLCDYFLFSSFFLDASSSIKQAQNTTKHKQRKSLVVESLCVQVDSCQNWQPRPDTQNQQPEAESAKPCVRCQQ